ncbi:TetR family transcriptional regulator [Streptomonospora alba]|uniref:TetR family transcriptional regulator n=1 Tax=Streptomonospora alba TaxID=183763 RepID=A0A0C2G8R4_9ACTN|nr:TetR/AcrR family transcriptional regulator [Streptomonospora alba]KIH99823.1 TetR family transcriptional regulator [Streptomonospora alba]
MPPGSAARSGTAGLRADALHNRNRILEVAGDLLAERGLDVPMAAIARHAGVGVATLYRRFPTRQALVREVFADRFAACASAVEDALAAPDPWTAFRTAVEQVCAVQAGDRGFNSAFVSAYFQEFGVGGELDRVMRGLTELTRRAKDAGRLRADFAAEDFTLLVMANSGISVQPSEAAQAASRRLVAYLLDAFRADRAGPADPLPPPAPLDLYDVLRPR